MEESHALLTFNAEIAKNQIRKISYKLHDFFLYNITNVPMENWNLIWHRFRLGEDIAPVKNRLRRLVESDSICPTFVDIKRIFFLRIFRKVDYVRAIGIWFSEKTIKNETNFIQGSGSGLTFSARSGWLLKGPSWSGLKIRGPGRAALCRPLKFSSLTIKKTCWYCLGIFLGREACYHRHCRQ